MKKIILAGCLMAGVTLFAASSGTSVSTMAPTQDTSHHNKMMQKKKMTTTDTSMHHKSMKKMKKDSTK